MDRRGVRRASSTSCWPREKAPLHEFDKTPFFEGCLPIEEMARRGRDTLRFGPMKPVGLTDPRTGRRAHAVVQLRQDNLAAEHYSMVGFQTQLRWPEQKRVFRMIPGLARRRVRAPGPDPPQLLHQRARRCSDPTCRPQARPGLFFAGQISGVEGYTESAATGLLAGINAARLVDGPAAADAAARDDARRAVPLHLARRTRRATSRPTPRSACSPRAAGRSAEAGPAAGALGAGARGRWTPGSRRSGEGAVRGGARSEAATPYRRRGRAVPGLPARPAPRLARRRCAPTASDLRSSASTWPRSSRRRQGARARRRSTRWPCAASSPGSAAAAWASRRSRGSSPPCARSCDTRCAKAGSRSSPAEAIRAPRVPAGAAPQP